MYDLSLLVFKDVGFKCGQHVCKKCHDISMIAFELKNIAIINKTGVDYRSVLQNMTKNDVIKRLNKLDDKLIL